jgi:hypothetical protein
VFPPVCENVWLAPLSNVPRSSLLLAVLEFG